MLTPSEALEQILARCGDPLEPEHVPIANAAGRCLAAPVTSDVDLPPFEKSAMDGYALRSADVAGGVFQTEEDAERDLACVGESRAGVPFEGAPPPYACVAIYTGAELPQGCDAVEMVEHTRREGNRVFFRRPVKPGQNVNHRAEVLAAGRTVFEPRRRLSAIDVSVLAAVGCDPVPVHRQPKVSILTTGDELVAVNEKPRRGQIREGNTLYLAATCLGLGCRVLRCGIVRDDPAQLELSFREALRDSDALITTGGVSVGRYDLVGAAFEKLGVEPIIHQVAIKPGKPIWFGLAGAKPVFGLPGNPVSSLLGFEVFVRPVLARLAGADVEEEAERLLRGRWLGPEVAAKGRQHNLPATVGRGADGVVELQPLPWKGSADIVALTAAGGLAVVPADGAIRTGEVIDYRPLSG
ncbi:MAG: molybdopterin molybdotransferase MoeA [Planctomycetota bacterium]|nr:molybdopterin molybdotransferase MoeA [Planctomycetota bacterium]